MCRDPEASAQRSQMCSLVAWQCLLWVNPLPPRHHLKAKVGRGSHVSDVLALGRPRAGPATLGSPGNGAPAPAILEPESQQGLTCLRADEATGRPWAAPSSRGAWAVRPSPVPGLSARGPRGGLRCSPTGSEEGGWSEDLESGAGSPPTLCFDSEEQSSPSAVSPPPVTPVTPVTAEESHPQPLPYPKPPWSPVPGDLLCIEMLGDQLLSGRWALLQAELLAGAVWEGGLAWMDDPAVLHMEGGLWRDGEKYGLLS
ncbi:unnamed protein product [Rangifer tarandus platyrhynchus]|uniref:Uncharacterized protein n=1 Tax=Rangifer tarandus platyrhynchus TaxID=3082113 RepID=A0ABN8Y0B7_RANTA|nr:unnamed protein product [Rangifer tarandus platyrhynchus]